MNNHQNEPRFVVFGGSGQLGTALRALLRGKITAPSHDVCDIVSSDVDGFLAMHRPDVVINCAAFHNVDRCEREPSAAFEANSVAVDRLAKASQQIGAVFVTVSTDYVFSGTSDQAYTERDTPSPRTTYGVSKLAGEFLTQRHGERSIIIRTSGVFGTTGTSSKGYTLIDRVLAQAERGELTRMVADMTFSPSFAPHVARAMCDLIEAGAFGLHHVTNAGHCSWFEFVQEAFGSAGYANSPLEAITYASLGNATQRPMFSPLENTTFSALGIGAMPHWKVGLDEFIDLRARRSMTLQE